MSLSRPDCRAWLTSSQEDLEASRARHDHATGSAVSSALGHRHPVEPEETVHTQLPSEGPAGSIFSNERITFPSPVERLAAEIITPGIRQLKPTPPRSVDILELEGPDPEEIYPPHSIFRDPSYADFAKLRNLTDPLPEDADCVDRQYFPELDRNGNFDQFTETITSYSESLGDYPPMGRSERCLDLVDQLIKGDDGYMVLFGRWRHRKDAPLSFVKDMIERELRGPGACSLYGPGGLEISDHPLVCHYNERLQQLQEKENADLQASETPLLSPILLQGSSASQRSAIRSATPVSFSMSRDGTFKATGFQMRTGSAGSTVESMSPIESLESATNNAQNDTRRDSGVYGVQHDASSTGVLDGASHTSLGNYEVLRHYTPDPALNYKALNDNTAPKYNRARPAMVTASYVKNFCRGDNRNMRPAARAPLQQQQTSQASTTQTLAHQGAPQTQIPQAPHNLNDGQARLGHELQRFHSRRYGQQEQRDYTAHQQNEALPTSRNQHPQCSVSAQQYQAPEARQQKHRLDESFTTSHVIPALDDRRITLCAPEDAENAMFSDEEDAATEIQQAPNNNNATNSSQPGSSSSKDLLNKEPFRTPSVGTHGTYPRSILKRASNDAAMSASSSVASATAKETAGLNTSTELTPLHATPGTTASSGHEYQIQSPARAQLITRKLDERLKQIEAQTFNKNCISL